MGLTSRLAAWAVDTSISDIPENVIDKSEEMILNAVGVGLAAATEKEVAVIMDFLQEADGKPECTVIGKGIRTLPGYAAWSNGVIMDLLDYTGSINQRDSGVSGVISPPVLALGEKMHLSGREVLEAFVVGCEVACTLGAAGDFEATQNKDEIPLISRNGFNTSSVTGVIGSAAAAGKLLRLTQTQMEAAFAIAIGMASGVKANASGVSFIRSFERGQASMNGIMAASLAQKGLSGPKDAIEGEWGLFDCFRRDTNVDEDDFFRSLGNPYGVIDPGAALKLYPSGSFTGTGIEATLQLVKEHRITPDQVESIHVAMVEPHVMTPFPHPQNGLQAKKSTPYTVAIALTHGPPQLHHFTDEAINSVDPQIRGLMDKVKVEFTERATRVSRPSSVTITLTGGQEVSYRAEYEKGHIHNPFTTQELDAKFAYCSRNVLSPAQIQDALDQFRSLDELPDVAPLIYLLGSRET